MGALSFFKLDTIKELYDCKFLVETGTCKGDSIKHAQPFDFSKIFSIEIHKPLAEKCQKLFQTDDRINILNTDSVTGLKQIGSQLKGNCVFWLDAHFPGSDTGYTGYLDEERSSLNMPLLKELQFISTRQEAYDDVILIDDLRMFEDIPPAIQATWNSTHYDVRKETRGVNGFDEHMQLQGQSNVKKSDVVHFDLNQVIQKLFPNKKVSREWVHEGYLILTPF
jgi:hypothetical protein